MKIQIIGGSGTGKSTLAKFISEQENIKWIDTDYYLWKDNTFTVNNPIELRRSMYEEDIETNSSYIVSGSVFSWCPEGFVDRDLLVFLSLDERDRLERLRTREIKRNGSNAMWLDENGLYTNDFLEWCKTYWTEEDQSIGGTFAEQLYQMELSKSTFIKLDSSQPVEQLYKEIMNKMQ